MALHVLPASSTVEPYTRSLNQAAAWACGCVIPSLEASPRWFIESSMDRLEMVLAVAQNTGFWGSIYTVPGTSWSTPPSVWFGPAGHSSTLRR